LPVLFENIDERIDPLFDSLFAQKKVKSGGSWKIKVGDSMLDYSPDFRLYVTTKLPRPHYPPEICVKVTLLNFTVTPEGLEDNMLNIVVKQEEPHMEEKRQNNIVEFFRNKDKQKQTEEDILNRLSNAEGNILDDEGLIEALKKSKFEAQEAANKLAELKRDQDKFAVIRNFYQKVAKRVSQLFFVVADMANIEPVYQYSLDWYIGLYLEGIRTSTPGKDNRCENIISKF
jgi:dynein heavy chain